MTLISKSPATAADVARMAGVSTATVSRFMNSPDLLARDTQQAVLGAVKQLNYRPNLAARNLAGGSTNCLGLVLPELGGPFFSELLAGVEEATREAGYHLLVAGTEPHEAFPLAFPSLNQQFVDGTIVFPDTLSPGMVENLAGHPVVLVEVSHPSLPTVAFDPSVGVREAIRHLVCDHGAERIACFAGPVGAEASRRREEACADELRSLGLAADPSLLVRGDWSERAGRQMAERLLEQGRCFDAIFSVNDEMAIGAVREIERTGLRVPDDVRVCGFDDIPQARWMRPALSTVAAPPRTLGRTAAEVLLARITGRPTPSDVQIPTFLVARETSGCGQELEREENTS
ncbi:MAG: LacI family DNA-binding transcriptional regulator [bacterium]|nr:LacI family DNA-binding transcriptional regulator [bacterium]